MALRFRKAEKNPRLLAQPRHGVITFPFHQPLSDQARHLGRERLLGRVPRAWAAHLLEGQDTDQLAGQSYHTMEHGVDSDGTGIAFRELKRSWIRIDVLDRQDLLVLYRVEVLGVEASFQAEVGRMPIFGPLVKVDHREGFPVFVQQPDRSPRDVERLSGHLHRPSDSGGKGLRPHHAHL